MEIGETLSTISGMLDCPTVMPTCDAITHQIIGLEELTKAIQELTAELRKREV